MHPALGHYYYYSSSSEALDLTLSSDYVEFSADQTWMNILEEGVNKAFAPKMLYHPTTGSTYMVYQGTGTFGDYVGIPNGQAFIMEFKSLYGTGRPFPAGKPPGTADAHQVPSMVILGENLHFVQETPHMVPLDKYKATDMNINWFVAVLNSIGTDPAYALLIKEPDDTVTIWHRGGGTNYRIHVMQSGADFSTWGSQVQVTAPTVTGGYRHYPGLIHNGEQGDISWRLIARHKEPVLEGPIRYEFFLLGTDRTSNYNTTYFNYEQAQGAAGAHSRDIITNGAISDANLANYLFWDTGGDTIQGYWPVATFTDDGNFVCVLGKGDGIYHLIWFADGSWQDRLIDIDNIVAIEDFVHEGLGNDGGIEYIFGPSLNDLTIYAYIQGTKLKPHRFRTTDLGVTWTDHGDMFPEVDVDLVGIMIPNNINDIPEDTNFPVIFVAADAGASLAGTRKVYIKRAAKGSLQSFQSYWDNVTAAANMDDADCIFYAEFSAENVTKTGTNITAITSIHGDRNMTPVNSPQWVSPNLITFNGTTQTATVPTTDITAITQQTLIVVGRCASGVEGTVFSFSDNTSTTEYIQYSINAAGGNFPAIVTRNGADLSVVEGQENTGDNALRIFVFTKNRITDRINVNGRWEYYEVSAATIADLADYNNIGDSNDLIATINRATVAGIDRSATDIFGAVTLAAIGLYDTIFSDEELHAKIKYLATRFSITLQEPYAQ